MKRKTLIIVGGITIVLLAAAVFVAARLLNRPGDKAALGANQISFVSDGGGGPVAFELEIKPAAELPTTPPEVQGLFVRREDNSIFIGTGEIEFVVEVDQATGEKKASADYSGPVLEVVVTHETSLYQDETEFPSPNSASTGKQTVQQVVSLVDSLDKLGEQSKNSEIQVWGKRSGDRVVAQVFVFRAMGS